ncbi:MAG: hypothetical protein WEA56_16325 [Balneolaceae bacterium]
MIKNRHPEPASSADRPAWAEASADRRNSTAFGGLKSKGYFAIELSFSKLSL